MSSIGKILSHAVDGMSAQTNALSSTSSNIVNATTPGFVRRRIITESLPSGGVKALMPLRPVDRFAESNVLAQAGYFASADTRASYLGRLQSLVAPANGNINEKVQAFFSAYTALSAAPADTVLRATALSRAQDVAAGFNSAARGVGTMRADLYVQSDQLIGEVNDRTQKIAKLNIQIAAMEGAGQSAADLRDTRDVLVREVAERTGATSIEDSSGAVTLLAMGTSLVEKGFASQLALKTTANDPEMKMRVVSTRPSGQDNDITSQISSGTLAALIESRDVAALRTVKDLDEFAFDFMKAVNDIHSQGVGLDLATPASSTQRFNLFTSAGTTSTGAAGSMKLVDTVAANPRLLATTSDVKLVPSGNDIALKIAALSREGLTTINGVPGPSAADRFGNMAGNIGSLIVSAQSDYRLRESTLAQAERLKESASGVSIEEEMANLTQFQRAFDASAKVMRTADELLQTLLQAVG